MIRFCACPKCGELDTEHIDTLWEDEYLQCDLFECPVCGNTFEDVDTKGIETDWSRGQNGIAF